MVTEFINLTTEGMEVGFGMIETESEEDPWHNCPIMCITIPTRDGPLRWVVSREVIRALMQKGVEFLEANP